MDPTILFIAEHSTGHRYLAKTRRISRFEQGKYCGSGLEWIKHREQYGDDVSIVWKSDPFTDEDEIREFAEFLSEELDVVASDQYLNRKVETGLDGGSSSDVYSPSIRNQMSESAAARAGRHTAEHLFAPEIQAKLKKPKSTLPPKIPCQHCHEQYRPNTHPIHEEKCYLNPINKRYCPVCGTVIKNNRAKKCCSRSCANVERESWQHLMTQRQ